MADGCILRVKVDNAQKEVTTLESYISYRITTETNIAELCKLRPSVRDDVERVSDSAPSRRFADSSGQDSYSRDSLKRREVFDNSDSTFQAERKLMTFSVRRRYNDFRWLFERLRSATLSGTSLVILAPFAERHVLNLDRFAPEFVVRRCALLNSFVQRVANHPKLRRSADLHALLAESASGFDNYVRAHTMSTSFIVSAKLLRAFERASGNDQNTLVSVSSAGGDESLVRFSNYGNRFNVLVNQLESSFQSFLTSHTTMANEYRELGSSFTQLSIGEPVSRRGLSTLAGACQTHATLTERLRDDAEKAAFSTLHDYVHFASPLRTFVHFASAFQSGNSGDSSVPVTTSATIANDASRRNGRAAPNEMVRTEIAHWHSEKARDFATFFSALAEAHCVALSQSIVAWEAAIGVLQQQLQLAPGTNVGSLGSSSTGNSNASSVSEQSRPPMSSSSALPHASVALLSPKSIAAVQRALTNPQEH